MNTLSGQNLAQITNSHNWISSFKLQEDGDNSVTCLMFEVWILRGCDWYWDKRIAYIEKTPGVHASDQGIW